MKMEPAEKIEIVLEHIKHVQENCYKLGLKLIRRGEIKLGQDLIANGQVHDNSKFRGIEFDHLFYGDPLLEISVKHHQSTNPHHPEYHYHIHRMPAVYLAEMACDIAARGGEFGTDVRKWVAEVATKKYGFSVDDEAGIALMGFLDELLSPTFK